MQKAVFACRVDRGTEGFETADLEHERAPLGFAAGVRRSASSPESPVDRTSGARGIPFLSRLIFHFFTEYNARRRRASGMLVASFETDIMRKSSNQSV
jgi:hypothetical protein